MRNSFWAGPTAAGRLPLEAYVGFGVPKPIRGRRMLGGLVEGGGEEAGETDVVFSRGLNSKCNVFFW